MGVVERYRRQIRRIRGRSVVDYVTAFTLYQANGVPRFRHSRDESFDTGFSCFCIYALCNQESVVGEKWFWAVIPLRCTQQKYR